MSFKRGRWNEVRWRLTLCVSIVLDFYDLVMDGALVLKGLCKECCKVTDTREIELE